MKHNNGISNTYIDSRVKGYNQNLSLNRFSRKVLSDRLHPSPFFRHGSIRSSLHPSRTRVECDLAASTFLTRRDSSSSRSQPRLLGRSSVRPCPDTVSTRVNVSTASSSCVSVCVSVGCTSEPFDRFERPGSRSCTNSGPDPRLVEHDRAQGSPDFLEVLPKLSPENEDDEHPYDPDERIQHQERV